MSAELLLKVSKPTVTPLVFKGMWQKDMLNGDGIIKLSNGLVILGQFKDGILKDTHMQVVYPNGDTYVGAHRSGVKHGLGTYTYNDEAGARYEGEWKDNTKHGKGELVFRKQNGAKFAGRFEEDQIVTGEYIDALGNSFKSRKHPDEGKNLTLAEEKSHSLSGRFEKGRLSGYGQADYAGGDQYIGMFKDGKRSGEGSMIFNQYNDVIMDYQQARFDGGWQRNKRYGYGSMTWPDGSRFEGEWRNDERVRGKLVMPDHNIYEGAFRHDKFHGVGKITYDRDGTAFEGIFENGLASTIGRLTPPDGAHVYIGAVEDLKKHGCGILIDRATGRRYEGEFEDDTPLGHGMIKFPNGDVYIGEVVKMQRQGPGRMEYKDGKIFEGQFEKDLREGVGYYFQSDRRVYCGQFRQDHEEGVGEYLLEGDIEQHFERVNQKQIAIIIE